EELIEDRLGRCAAEAKGTRKTLPLAAHFRPVWAEDGVRVFEWRARRGAAVAAEAGGGGLGEGEGGAPGVRRLLSAVRDGAVRSRWSGEGAEDFVCAENGSKLLLH